MDHLDTNALQTRKRHCETRPWKKCGGEEEALFPLGQNKPFLIGKPGKSMVGMCEKHVLTWSASDPLGTPHATRREALPCLVCKADRTR